MSWLARMLLAALLPLAAGAPAAAHSPYFTETRDITLPDGKPGQLRILKGDGIVGADPARAVVLDAEGRALARSPSTVVILLTCIAPGLCAAVDPGNWTTYEIDPASFRVGEIIRPRQDAIWALERGSESWGFRARWATIPEIAKAEVAQIQSLGATALAFVAIGALFAVALVPRLRWPRDSGAARRLAFFGWAILRVVILLASAWVSAMLAFLAGVTTPLWLILMGLGTVLAAPLIRLVARRRAAAAAI